MSHDSARKELERAVKETLAAIKKSSNTYALIADRESERTDIDKDTRHYLEGIACAHKTVAESVAVNKPTPEYASRLFDDLDGLADQGRDNVSNPYWRGLMETALFYMFTLEMALDTDVYRKRRTEE